MQLVFGRDAVLNTRFIDYWEANKGIKNILKLSTTNQRTNAKRKAHLRTSIGKVTRCSIRKIGTFCRNTAAALYEGTIRITSVNEGAGTIRIKRDKVYDTVK